MATTTLIFENIIIGCYTWTWVVALLVRFGTINGEHWELLRSGLKDSPAPIGVAFILIIYPIGSMMNTVCYCLARKIFGQRQEQRLLKKSACKTLADFPTLEMFVAQHGTERVYADILSFRPFMRISRAAVLHSLLLACVLFSFGRELLPWALLSLGIFGVALPACWYAYRFKIEETIAAYAALHLRSPKGATTDPAEIDEEVPGRVHEARLNQGTLRPDNVSGTMHRERSLTVSTKGRGKSRGTG